MSKIRWSGKDEQKILNMIAKFNSKIYRVRSRKLELRDIQPKTITKAETNEIINKLKSQTRAEFNKFYNSLERYTRKGAEKEIVSKTGNRVTKWEKKEISLKVAKINRERAKERMYAENMEAISRGTPIGLKRGEMGSERLNELRPKKFNFDAIRGGKEWQLFKASVEKQASFNAKLEKQKLFKMNYIKGLYRVMGDYAFDTIEKLKQLPPEKIIDIFYADQEATIEFIYDPLEMERKLEIIEQIWENEHKQGNSSYGNWSMEDENTLSEWFAKEGIGVLLA